MLTHCPICSAPVKEQAMECACGELLTSWSTLRTQGEALRQRGLTLAAQADHVGALVSFLEAALTCPQDGVSLLDAAKSLTLLGRYEDAMRLLAHVGSKPAMRPAAEAVAAAIKARARAQAVAAKEQKDVTEAVEEVKEVETAARPTLGLERLERPKGGFFSKAREVDPAWKPVLRLERDGADFRSDAPWLAAAICDVKGHDVFHYLLGLGAWQRGDREAAVARFARCLEEDPPVLNPAAYYLCLHLKEDGAAAVERLKSEYGHGEQEIDVCLTALAAGLRGAEDGLYKAARALISE